MKDNFSDSDYINFVDGRPRRDGIEKFLNSRKIQLSPLEIEEISQKKNKLYLEILERNGIEIVKDTMIFIHYLHKEKIPMGVVSSSINAHKILRDCQIEDVFEVIITPEEAFSKSLKGKPSPDYFLEATKIIKVNPSVTTIVEDSLAGIEAAVKGGFGEVIGFNSSGDRHIFESLIDKGAHIAVDSLLKLKITSTFTPLPNLMDHVDEIFFKKNSKNYYLFLDLDRSIFSIKDWHLQKQTFSDLLDIISKLSHHHHHVSIVTGHDLAVIKNKLPFESVSYIASHGFEILTRNGVFFKVCDFDFIEQDFHEAMLYFKKIFSHFLEANLERKKFSLFLDYRNLSSYEARQKLVDIVKNYVHSRKVFKIQESETDLEILPKINWDKGKAMKKIYELFNIDKSQFPPIYLGDGKNDEDAFREMRYWGISVLADLEERFSMASYRLVGPCDVKLFLEKYLSIIRGSHD